MRTTIHKVFWIWQFDKEERWLNEMAAKGKALISTGFCTYVFEDCEPGEYIYRLELMNDLPSSEEGRSYIRFLEETGAEQVGSYLRWCYFRRKASLGEFDLFSDYESRIKHLDRILWLAALFLPMELYWGIYNLVNNREYASGLIVGCISLLVAMLFVTTLIIVGGKRHKLKKEREISEN
jgi:hypothetical protein